MKEYKNCSLLAFSNLKNSKNLSNYGQFSIFKLQIERKSLTLYCLCMG